MDPDVADALAKSFLGRLPAEVVDPLIADQIRLDYPSGTTIYREGEAARAMLMVSGLIRIYMTSPEGRQVTVRYGRPSDVLGTALVVGGPFDVNAMTLAPSSVFVLDARTLADAARRDVRLAYAMAEEMGRRLQEALQQIAIHAFGSVKQRVASHLLDLASTQQRPEAPLVAQVSQQGVGRRHRIRAGGRGPRPARSARLRDRLDLDGQRRDPRSRPSPRGVLGQQPPVTSVTRRRYPCH
jgi:CRP/FNR family transcriptional regulator, cyclic AMP receptor protein